MQRPMLWLFRYPTTAGDECLCCFFFRWLLPCFSEPLQSAGCSSGHSDATLELVAAHKVVSNNTKDACLIVVAAEEEEGIQHALDEGSAEEGARSRLLHAGMLLEEGGMDHATTMEGGIHTLLMA